MSEVWNSYAKIMTEKGIIKTADKKDEAYNVVPPSPGADTPQETTGYELIENAHSQQVQVANSQLNDGIVENGVEQKKVMVDVALRNPRGVLAQLMETLVKAANVLEEDMTPESLKMAIEVDKLLEKLAQVKPKRVSANFADLLTATERVADSFKDQKFSTFGLFESTDAKNVMDAAAAKYRNYLREARQVGSDEEKIALGQEITAYTLESNASIRESLDSIRSKAMIWGQDPKKIATDAWNDLYEQSLVWNAAAPQPQLQQMQQQQPAGVGVEQDRGMMQRELPKGSPSGHSAKVPTHKQQHFFTHPEVAELQTLLGVSVDGKLGPQTFAAVMNEVKNDPNLKEYLDGAPIYTEGYQHWDLAGVQHAILAIKQFRQTKEVSQAQNNKNELLTPYTSYEEGFQAGKSKI